MIKKCVTATCCVGLLASQVAFGQGEGPPAQGYGYGYGPAPYGQPPARPGTGGYPYPGQAPPSAGPASEGGKSNPMKQMMSPMGNMMDPMKDMMGGPSGQGQAPPGYGRTPGYGYGQPPGAPGPGGYGYPPAGPAGREKIDPMSQMMSPMGKMMEPMNEMMRDSRPGDAPPGYGQAPGYGYGQPPGAPGPVGYGYPPAARVGHEKTDPMSRMMSPMDKMMEPMKDMVGGGGPEQSPSGYSGAPAYATPTPPAQGGYGYGSAPPLQAQPPTEEHKAPQ